MTDTRPTKKLRTLIDALLALKMVSTFWNCMRFPAQGGYDDVMHCGRAMYAGLRATRMEYDPPLYYFVGLPSILPELAARKSAASACGKGPSEFKEYLDGLMTVLEYSNLVYLLIFYVAWIYIIFPRILPGARSWAVASVILLALPGYQKLAAMVHSDNMFAAFTAGSFACWLWLDQRRARFEGVGGRGQPYRLRALFGLATLIGVTGLTRPFAVLPVALFSILALREVWGISRRQRRPIGRFVARAAPLMLLVGVLSGSWYVYRWRVTRGHDVLDAYNHSYMDAFQPYKSAFDFKHYYTSFYFKELVHTPNRNLFKEDKDHGYFPTSVGEKAKEEDYEDDEEREKNIYANSFFTLLYSEMWADQWLYFSGRGEEKLWLKRIVLVGAMPLSLFLVAAWPLGLLRSLREIVRRRRWVTRQTIVLAMTFGAAALYLWWQTHAGLLPGKNSTVKFIYIAYAVPFALAMCMSYRMRRREYRIMLPLCLLTYALAIPIAFYWDSPKPHHRRNKRDQIERPVEGRLAIPPPTRSAG